jgi:hypothetical protein
MQSAAKADALVRDLADKLAKRYANGPGLNSLRIANDAQGWPMIFISTGGNEAEGQPVVLIRIRNVDMVSKDVFGNSTFAYAPHTLEFAYELASSNDPIPTLADLAAAQFESIKTGVRFQLKTIANGTAVTEASLNAAAPVADLEELYWPTKSV